MSDAGDAITIGGDIANTNGAAIGANATAQSVSVHVALPEQPTTMKEQIKAIWLIVLNDQKDRQERQQAIDERLSAIAERFDRIEQWMQRLIIGIATIVLVVMAYVAITLMR